MHGLVYSGSASCPNHITAALSLILNPSIQSHPNQIQRNMKVKLWFPIALLVLALEFNRLCWTGSLEKSTQKSCLSTALALSLVGTGWRVPGKTLLFVMKPSYWSHEQWAGTWSLLLNTLDWSLLKYLLSVAEREWLTVQGKILIWLCTCTLFRKDSWCEGSFVDVNNFWAQFHLKQRNYYYSYFELPKTTNKIELLVK